MYLTPVFIFGIIVIGIYRVFELFVRKNERMAIIEKLSEQIKLSEANVDLNLPLFKYSKSNWALKISLLLIGIGIGVVVAYLMEWTQFGLDVTNNAHYLYYRAKIEMVYYACVAFFGGIGLLSAYFIERKHITK